MNKRLFNQQNLTRRLRLLSVLFAMLLMPFSAWAQDESPTSYDINVAGIPVTSQNASNITGDNIEAYTAGEPYSVSYDAASNTLSLTNARIASGGIASTSDAALNVALNNSVVLGGTGVNGISCAGDLSISAVGTNYVYYPVTSTKDGGATLTLQNGRNADARLTLDYQESESGFNAVVYDGLYLSADNLRTLKFSASRQRFEESEGAWASTIKFSNAKTYELWLGGTKVTESNKDNILGDWGSATFDPDENLLTLNGMTLTGTGIYTDGIISRLPNLTISVNGDNTITCSDSCSVIRADMEGAQTLTILKGSDGCSLTLDGSRVIRDFNTFTATGLSWNDSFTYKYDETLTSFSAGYRLMKADGEEASRNYDTGFKPALYDESVTPYDLWVAGVQVTSANAEDICGRYIDGTVSFDAANNVLTLERTTIDLENVFNGIAVASGIADLTINLVGDNSVTPHVNTPFFAMYTGETGATAPTLTFNTDYYLDDGLYWLGTLKFNGIVEIGSLTSGYDFTLGESPEYVDPENAGNATTGWKFSLNYDNEYLKVWKLETFDLWLDGNRVLSSDLGAGLSDGPKYNPVTERLVFSNNMTTDAPVMSSMAELTVEINGACSITPESSSPAIYFQEKGEVTSGSLTFVRGDDAVTASLTLTANGENQSMEPYKAIEGYSASDIRFGADLNLTSPTTVTEALDATTVTIGGETYYNLKVGGVYVSQTNAADVLGDGGSVTFTVTDGQEAVPTYTLTLNGAALTDPIIIGMDLTIDIQGTNSITTEERCIQKMENTTPAVTFTSTSDVVGSLTLNGAEGVNSVGEYNEGSFSISDKLALVLKKDGYLYSNQYWFTDGSTKEAKLSPSYGVTVGGMQICPDNAADVIGDGIGRGDDSGMVSFDKDNSILTLNNASLSGIIRSSLPNLTIELVGNNSIYSGGDRILQTGDDDVNMTIQSSAAVKGCLRMHKGYSSSELGYFVDDNIDLTILEPLAVVSGSLEDNSSSNDYYANIGEPYNLWVGGTQVTSANSEDILSDYDGTMSFDAANKILTISNVGELPFGIESALDALTIKVSGVNTIYSESGAAISYTGDETGTLTFVKDADSDLTSLTLTAYGSNENIPNKAIAGYALDNITITTPMRLTSPTSMDDMLNATSVTIADYSETYDIKIAGTTVTDANKDDVLGDGTVRYEDDTNTLLLDNATIISDTEEWGIIYSGTRLFTISLNGANTVKGGGDCGAILYNGQGIGQDPTQVTSPELQFIKTYDAQPGSLTLNGISGFDDGAISLEDNLVAVGDLTNCNELTYIELGYRVWVDGLQLSEHNTVSGMTFSNNTLSLSGIVSSKNIRTSIESLTVRITGTNKLGTIGFDGNDGDDEEEGTLTFVKNDQSTAPENSLTLLNEEGGGAIYGFSEVNIQSPLMLKTPEAIPEEWAKTPNVVISDVTEVINYDLTVAGTPVTSTNAVDVLGNGKVSYANGMLTLNGAALESGITSGLDQLKIVLVGTNSIAGTITGTTGTLYFATDASDAKLTFTTESASAVSGFTEVKYLNGLRMKSVAGGFDVSIPSDYNLMVGGKAVTSDNREDVFGDGGSVIYDGEYTLILTNAELTKKIELGSDNTLDQLYIHLAGQENTITSADNVIVATAKPNMELHFVTNGSSPGKLVYTSTNASDPTVDGAFTGFSGVSFDNELEAVLSGKTITIAQKIEPIINDDPTSGKSSNANVDLTDANTEMEQYNTPGANLNNMIVGDILFTLNDDGTKNSPDGYDGKKVVINSKMSDDALEEAMNLEPGSEDFANTFKGLTFKLPASTGTISIEAWSDCGHQMCVKIGDQTATYITLTDEPTTYNVDYTCSTDTYVYIYLPQPSSSSAPRHVRGRIGPKSGVSGGLGNISVSSNSLVSSSSSQPSSNYMLLDKMAADAVIASVIPGEGLAFNDASITDLEDDMFLAGGVSGAQRRSAPTLKISSDLPFIDMRGTSIKNMEVSRSSGPFNGVPENVFIYMPEGNTTSEKNVVIGDVCDRMELKAELPGSGVNEAKPFKVSKNFTAAQATLMRTFAAGGDDSKATIYLPYAIPQETANQLGQFFEFDGIDGDVVKMTMVTSGGLKANMPYIFQAKEGGVVNPEVKIVTVQGSPAETEGFKGVYEQTTCGGDNWYGYAAEEVDGATIGQFVKLGTGASIAPFRAYMVADGGVPSYAIRWGGVDDETTAIEEPEIKTVNERKPVEGWYTLTGARLMGQPTKPGLYIYNGRTVVVK